ncbi:MAG TPA: hypothetical protein DCE24_05615 [Porphyromonadaceae bacterium]|nr:C1 family peptidase [Paramuribaculum sp.]HAB41316.1 hypothetical protein [Porphyromonadaceae bacterium]
MTPILTIWPSGQTELLRKKVDSLLTSDEGQTKYYGSINEDDCRDKDSLISKLREEYRRLIDISAIDTTLNIVCVLPLFGKNPLELISRIIEATAHSGDSCTLQFLCLRHSLAAICGDTETPASENSDAGLLEDIGNLCINAGFQCSAAPIDNYIASGASAGFDADSLALYFHTLLRSYMEKYGRIFRPSLFSDSRMLALGLSQVEFPRERICSHLLNRAFIAAIENSGAMTSSVDAQAASLRAKNSLSGFDTFFDDFYRKEVERKRDIDIDEDVITAQIATELKNATDKLADHAMEFINDPALSLPEKEAVFALMLGEDSTLLTGVQFDSNTALADDAFSSPLSLFINTFNSLPEIERQRIGLPMRESVEGLKKYTYGSNGDLIDDPCNQDAFDALPAIKLLKRDIQDETAHIRQLRQRIEDIETADKQRTLIEDNLSDHGKPAFPTGPRKIKEQPLDQIYAPKAGIAPKKSVDLRQYFSPAKSQGAVGSCSTFAAVAMYEVAMNRTAEPGSAPADMSERFVFYHSNVEKGKPEGGSNFYEQLEVLGKYGTCHESQCPYSGNNLTEPPSEEATQEALNHRVLVAKQIPIRTKGSKIECLKENHRLFTSALSEGYPVGISLKVYNSLETIATPYVNVPDENDILSGGESGHAMVLAGYSESENCYIVKNSWGAGYGDNGYIYVSAAYIDDPDYNSFACIITETTEKGAADTPVPQFVASFAGTEAEIKIATIKNALDLAQAEFADMKRQYSDLYRYYSSLITAISNPQIRRELRTAAQLKTADALNNVIDVKKRLTNEFTETFQTKKKEYIKRALSVTASALAFASVNALFVLSHIGSAYTFWIWIAAGVLTLIAAMLWINYHNFKQRIRTRLNLRIQNLSEIEGKLRKELLETRIKYHTAGMVIDRLHDLISLLSNRYRCLKGYNRTLREWHSQYKAAEEVAVKESEAMFIFLYDKKRTDSTFTANIKRILQDIDLNSEFSGYGFTEEGITLLRQRLEKRISQAIETIFSDFTMEKYLRGTEVFPYIPGVEMGTLATRLARMALPTCRMNEIDNTGMALYVRINVDSTGLSQWDQFIKPYFPTHPLTLQSADSDILTVITVIPVPSSSFV